MNRAGLTSPTWKVQSNIDDVETTALIGSLAKNVQLEVNALSTVLARHSEAALEGGKYLSWHFRGYKGTCKSSREVKKFGSLTYVVTMIFL